MNSFALANQARLSLKMILADYAWYGGSSVEAEKTDYVVVVYVDQLDNERRKIIPAVHGGVSVKTDVSGKNKKQRQGY